MKILIGAASALMILIVLLDAFESVVLPRRVSRKFRLTRFFFTGSWSLWSALARLMPPGKRRLSYLSYFGPLSLIMLLGIWAGILILSFALLQWSCGSAINTPEGSATFFSDLYISGTTFFTLGLGDLTPRGATARVITVIESGMGFGFLAIVIGYLPVIYQAFSRREVNIALLDARAGSPPNVLELMRRHSQIDGMAELAELLREWERWSSELLESHLSYPVLCYYRSQHDNQSWLSALTMILDVSALVIAGIDGAPARQALLTFAIARHAIVDLAQVFNTAPRPSKIDRLSSEDLKLLRTALADCGLPLRSGKAIDKRLTELRQMYEPYVGALADYLFMSVPPWILPGKAPDNWQTSAWERIANGATSDLLNDEHCD
jgi:hypothetical protein